MNNDRLEIIVTTGDEPTPQRVRFEELYTMRESITSIVFLWNTNSYFVDVERNIFMLNGGRKIAFTELGDCHLLYRKRSAANFSVGSSEVTSKREVAWLLGLENEKEDKLFLIIQSDGKSWQWANEL